MALSSSLQTPGVYISEESTSLNSATQVATSVPVFIGYTEKAEYDGKSLLKQPTMITSMTDYETMFGGSYLSKFSIEKNITDIAAIDPNSIVYINGVAWCIEAVGGTTLYLYNSLRFYFANGGGPCYIYAAGIYADYTANGFDESLFTGKAFNNLAIQPDITLVLAPDALVQGEKSYNTVYQAMLQHCADTQSRFAILDLAQQPYNVTTDDMALNFRSGIGVNNLNYGAAYYPWLNTGIVPQTEIGPQNLQLNGLQLTDILPESGVAAVVTQFEEPPVNYAAFNNALLQVSPTYSNIIQIVGHKINQLPPSGAMAGIYNKVDNTEGVWMAPANVSVSSTYSPAVPLTDSQQAKLNVDISGKSIDCIRSFNNIGVMVWGARTLDANSQDWRYINVRRTVIMIEQSIKAACKAFVFEPNVPNTWMSVNAMISNFLTNVWKEGGLMGASASEAFSVAVGLGSTMTAQDILNGYMNVVVEVAVVHPAEFIVITVQQEMQSS